ncbi:hypothetical protein B296_00020686 [Ensete ventricosum]|uniref:Reverse transcriptase domain-containing protein n=1 Tax=Ensete ventricosum TaxID=4639 RepID=A0A427AV22_ENSVE|nr:hypothetical protein B296_00020686 [Ensete ventricosum]
MLSTPWHIARYAGTIPKQSSQHRYEITKSCRFHQDHGHDTKDCYTLKEQIEELIQRRHLNKFLPKAHETSPRPQDPLSIKLM